MPKFLDQGFFYEAASLTLLKKIFILKRLQNKFDVEIRASLKTSSHAFFLFFDEAY